MAYYVGGRFTKINEEVRFRLASFTTSDGALTSWNPKADNDVESMDEEDGTIYIGGNFSKVGKWASMGALIDLETGDADDNFPDLNTTVRTAVKDGNGGWYN
jgi:hypothetical protein